MTVNITLLVLMGVLLAVGVYLLLERSLTRVLLGIIMISNGVNLLILQTAGPAADAPLINDQGRDNYLDPLPQALLLTAIVIAFALTAFMLALIYRSWMLARQGEISDDEEDRRLAEVVDAYDPEEDDEIGAETSEFDEEDRVAGSEAAVLPRSSDERAEGKEGGTR